VREGVGECPSVCVPCLRRENKAGVRSTVLIDLLMRTYDGHYTYFDSWLPENVCEYRFPLTGMESSAGVEVVPHQVGRKQSCLNVFSIELYVRIWQCLESDFTRSLFVPCLGLNNKAAKCICDSGCGLGPLTSVVVCVYRSGRKPITSRGYGPPPVTEPTPIASSSCGK
jgi:hypothetical protein